jgi:hypothetical protein
MRPGLAGLIVVGAAIAAAVTEVIVFRVVNPPDGASALLGGLWVAMPYLAAAGLALLVRRHHAALITLLVALLVAAGVGLPLLGNAATQQAAAERQVQTAVQPGEDPHSGPAAMRKSGAEIGQSITSVFSVLLAVFVPPIQLGVVLVPTVIAWAVSALRRGSAEGGELAA